MADFELQGIIFVVVFFIAAEIYGSKFNVKFSYMMITKLETPFKISLEYF